jgi:thioredoxin-like negative regulator of GroEL
LKGNWVESEHLICRVLRRAPRDLDAGLMLATLLRHTGRLEEAQRQLDRIVRFEGAHKWALEIRREREFLDEARKARASESEKAADGASKIADVA